jgi:cell wall-associated NlpC family hydrolase
MPAVPVWVGEYVGIPFKERGGDKAGCNCWGLVRLVLKERYEIDAPALSDKYVTTADVKHTEQVINGEASSWRHIMMDDAAPGDVITMYRVDPVTRTRVESHVGVVIAKGWMLHIERNVDASKEEYTGRRHMNQVANFYRWSPA